MSIINGTKVTAWGGTVLVGAVLLGGFEAAAAESLELATWIAPETEGVPTVTEDGGALRVEVEPGLVDAELIPGWIEKRNPDLGQTLEVAGHEQWIEVEVGGATYDYRVAVTAVRDGVAVGEVKEPLTCVCNYEELMEMIDGEVTAAVLRLLATTVVSEEDGEGSEEPEPVVPVESVQEPEKKRRLTRTGIAGIAVGSVGVVALGVGIGLVAAGEQDHPEYYFLERNYRPSGYVALSIGLAGIAGGAAMLALDLTRCKRQPNARGCNEGEGLAGARRPRVAGIVTGDMAGISMTGRF